MQVELSARVGVALALIRRPAIFLHRPAAGAPKVRRDSFQKSAEIIDSVALFFSASVLQPEFAMDGSESSLAISCRAKVSIPAVLSSQLEKVVVSYHPAGSGRHRCRRRRRRHELRSRNLSSM